MGNIKKFENFDDAFVKRLRVIKEYSATNNFWDFVGMVEWDLCKLYPNNKTKYDIENIMDKCAPHYSWKKFKQFKKEYDKLYIYLYHRYRDVWLGDPGIEISDDSYSDLISSVIGYGKKHFMEIIMDDTNKNITEQGNSYDFCENFGYVFHILYDEDSTHKSSKDRYLEIEDRWNKIYNSNNKNK